jgi:hypothetical protein
VWKGHHAVPEQGDKEGGVWSGRGASCFWIPSSKIHFSNASYASIFYLWFHEIGANAKE